jgi:hypothetical protein
MEKFFLFFVLMICALGARSQRVVPYPCDSLWALPGTKPEVVDHPDKKVFLFSVPDQVLNLPQDTVCFANEALIIKKGQTFIEMRTADKKNFYRFVKTSKGVTLYRYPPPFKVIRA